MKGRIFLTSQFVRFKMQNKMQNYYLGVQKGKVRRPNGFTRRKKLNLGKTGISKGGFNDVVDRISQLPDEVLASIVSHLPLKEAAATSMLSRRWQYVWTSSLNLTRRKKVNLGKTEINKGVDRISKLPDELLVSIVSHLPLKEAAATSVLSRRWQYVWMSSRNLNFSSGFDVTNSYEYFYRLRSELRDQKTRGYVDWVNRMMEQHRGITIEQFRISWHMDSHFTSIFDKWIQIAMNKRVQILELDFRIAPYHHVEHQYTLSKELLGLEKVSPSKLHFEIPSLRPCGDNSGYKYLKVLQINYVCVTGETLEYFLSNCPILERLKVSDSLGSLVNLRVVGPSVALKYLTIVSCPDIKTIEICDVNLVSFSYRGKSVNLLVRNVPQLVDVSISEPSPIWLCPKSIMLSLTRLSCCLSQLEVLEIDISTAAYKNQQYEFPILPNVKYLKLVVDAAYKRSLFQLTSFMKACPYLQRLMLKVKSWGLSRYKGITKVAKCPHSYLKVVEILGYYDGPAVTEHVGFLIRSAVGLKKIVIDPDKQWMWYRHYKTITEFRDEAEARDHAMRLKRKVPSTIEFVCL